MKLITFKSIAFLLKLSADIFSFINLKEETHFSVNNGFSLSTTNIVISKIQQKSFSICVSRKHTLQIKNYILHNILVGKDRSVVTTCGMIAPTANILQL